MTILVEEFLSIGGKIKRKQQKLLYSVKYIGQNRVVFDGRKYVPAEGCGGD